MIRAFLFVLFSLGLVGYAFWIYRRFELRIPETRWLAITRGLVLVTILVLLFDPRLPSGATGASSDRWVLLDASLSMAAGPAGSAAWVGATARARELQGEGWRVVRFGQGVSGSDLDTPPQEVGSRLAPVLERAAEAGVSEVRVLSDLRVEDGVAVRGALETLPISVIFERFGADVINAGVAGLSVADAARPEGAVEAVVEVHGNGADSVSLEIQADGEVVATEWVSLPAPGLRRAHVLDIPVPSEPGRVRYTATVSLEGDGFASDDQGVDYASVGFAEGALVFVSLSPDWEPRYLLPLLAEVTGLRPVGYLRAGDDRFVPIGVAVDRGAPFDSAAVRRAVADAEVLVVHGASGSTDAWGRSLSRRSGRVLLLPRDAAGAEAAGIATAAPAVGEWYASGDIPPSPISGALAGATLLGLPPLTDVLVPSGAQRVLTPVSLQLRGTGTVRPAFYLDPRPSGRRVVGLAGGYWRWAMREGAGQDAYRRLWSGLAGWLLADEGAAAPEPRPAAWVFERDEPVDWRLSGDTAVVRIQVSRDEAEVVDTTLIGATGSIGILDPGSYTYRATDGDGGPVSEGRFDVAEATRELLPSPSDFGEIEGSGVAVRAASAAGRPLRTSPWPYLLVIILLCGEWIVRRRSGLR